eukprot:scaffold27921_cov37-Tisochrysis_lutea.AAC.2
MACWDMKFAIADLYEAVCQDISLTALRDSRPTNKPPQLLQLLHMQYRAAYSINPGPACVIGAMTIP